MNNKITPQIPPELAEEHDEYVTHAVRLARNQLSPAQAAAVRKRMDDDDIYRAVVQPILDAYDAPMTPTAELERSWQDFRRRAGLVAEPVSDSLADFEARVRAREGRVRRIALRIAAVLVILMALPVGFWIYADLTFYTKYETAANVTSVIAMPDGSTAQLAPSSRLVYWKNMTNRVGTLRREVTLYGSAEFTVKNFVDKKFSVQTQHAIVTALGTRFRVQELDGFTRVEVDEGSVSIQARSSNGEPVGQPVTFGAGWRVRALPSGVLAEGTPGPPPNFRRPQP